MMSSLSKMAWEASMSLFLRASTEPRMASSTMLPSRRISSFRCWISCSKALRMIYLLLAEAPGDVILGTLVVRVGEDLLVHCPFHQLSLQEEGGIISCSGCLLNGVGNQNDGVILLEKLKCLLHLAG